MGCRAGFTVTQLKGLPDPLLPPCSLRTNQESGTPFWKPNDLFIHWFPCPLMLPTGGCSILGFRIAPAWRNEERQNMHPQLVQGIHSWWPQAARRSWVGTLWDALVWFRLKIPVNNTLCLVLLPPVLFHKGGGSYRTERAPVNGLCPRGWKAFLPVSPLEQAGDLHTLAPVAASIMVSLPAPSIPPARHPALCVLLRLLKTSKVHGS